MPERLRVLRPGPPSGPFVSRRTPRATKETRATPRLRTTPYHLLERRCPMLRASFVRSSVRALATDSSVDLKLRRHRDTKRVGPPRPSTERHPVRSGGALGHETP